MDHRPSDLDPYPRFGRDLATLELWDQSLERSKQRRRLEAASRSHRQRRKGTSIAVGAAMLAAPVVPAFAGGSRGGSPKGASGQGGRADTPVDTSSLAAATGGGTQLLRFGDVGPAVTAIQRQVGVTADGIFGPITRGAVERFQRDHGLGMTGIVDARTWAALFNGRVLFYDAPGSRAAAARPAAAPRASVRLVVDRSGSAGAASLDGTGAVSSDEGDGGSPPGASGSSASSGSGPAESGSGSGGSAPQSSAPAPAKHATPAPKQTTPVPTPTTSAGGCTSGRIVSPVSGATLTGRFGESRPGHLHAGDDLAVASGTPIHAAQCGTVVQSGAEQGYGLMVCIRHAGGITTCYAHMSRTAATVSQQVQAGQVIGYVGCTGNCTGPHVHFEVRRGGTAVDPAPYLAGTQSIAGTTSTASASHATAASTRRTTTTSAGTSSRATVRAAVVRSSATGGVEAGAAAPAVTAAAAQSPAPVAAAAPSAAAPAPAAPAPAAAPAAAQPSAAPAPAAAESSAAPAQSSAAPAQSAPAPAPAAAQSSPAPEPAQSAPAQSAAAPQPAPASEPAQSAPAPQAAPEASAPAPQQSAPAPRQTAPAPDPAPAPTQTAPAPAPAPKAPAPAPAPAPPPTPAPAPKASTPAPEPAPAESAPAPQQSAPTPAPVAEQAPADPAPAAAPQSAPAAPPATTAAPQAGSGSQAT